MSKKPLMSCRGGSTPPSTKALQQDEASSHAQIGDKVQPHMRLVLPASTTPPFTWTHHSWLAGINGPSGLINLRTRRGVTCMTAASHRKKEESLNHYVLFQPTQG